MRVLILLRVLLNSVLFNFRHLPVNQAVILPILVYKIDDMGGVK